MEEQLILNTNLYDNLLTERKGDDASSGVYLASTAEEGAAPLKVPVVIANSPSQVTVRIPTLVDGQQLPSLPENTNDL